MPFDFLPSAPIEIETRKAIVSSESDVGARVALRKSKAHRFFQLILNLREKSEADAILALWDETFPDGLFTWSNIDCGIEEETFFFDSAIRSQPASYNAISLAFAIKQKDPVTYAVPANNNLPLGPEWAHEVEQNKSTLVSDSSSYTRKATARSAQRRRFRLEFQIKSLVDTQTLESFWCHHYPGKKINLNVYLTTENLHLDGDFWIVSDFKWSVYTNRFVCRFEILEV